MGNLLDILQTRKNEFVNCLKLALDTNTSYKNNYQDEALEKNLVLWAKNKQLLYNCLSSSPFWNEKEMAIVVPHKTLYRSLETSDAVSGLDIILTTVENNISNLISKGFGLCEILILLAKAFTVKHVIERIGKNEVLLYAKNDYNRRIISNLDYVTSRMEFYIGDFDTTEEEIEKTHELIRKIRCCEDYENGLANFEEFKALQINTDLKPSKWINKVFSKQKDILNSLEYDCSYERHIFPVVAIRRENEQQIEYTSFYKYEQIYAKIADFLSPLKYERTIILSIHPLDYMFQSNGKFGSCHDIRAEGGCYHSATLSMLTDEASLITYITHSEDDVEKFAEKTKQERFTFYVSRCLTGFAQNYSYPNRSFNDLSKIIREILESTITSFLGIENLWKKVDIENLYFKDDNYLGYKEYKQHDGRTVAYSTVGTKDICKTINVGNVAYCIDDKHEYIKEEDCLSFNEKYGYCEDCGGREVMCDLIEVREGYYVCSDCLNDNYVWCDSEDCYCEIDEAIYCEDDCCWYPKDLTDEYGIYKCKFCGNWYHEENMEWYDGYKNDKYCNNCADYKLTYCEDCGKRVPKDKLKLFNGTYYCEDCFSLLNINNSESESESESERGEF